MNFGEQFVMGILPQYHMSLEAGERVVFLPLTHDSFPDSPEIASLFRKNRCIDFPIPPVGF